mmetsp:Transcript_14082/g.48511  ORF Transcript_14082/g.48511 Transcript_14082/m.48511 type:complete len:238 (+) Transcript_14082:986-1699(+)
MWQFCSVLDSSLMPASRHAFLLSICALAHRSRLSYTTIICSCVYCLNVVYSTAPCDVTRGHLGWWCVVTLNTPGVPQFSACMGTTQNSSGPTSISTMRSTTASTVMLLYRLSNWNSLAWLRPLAVSGRPSSGSSAWSALSTSVGSRSVIRSRVQRRAPSTTSAENGDGMSPTGSLRWLGTRISPSALSPPSTGRSASSVRPSRLVQNTCWREARRRTPSCSATTSAIATTASAPTTL